MNSLPCISLLQYSATSDLPMGTVTVRLTDGSLTLQVNVIGNHRVQGTSGVACHVIVDATGEKLSPERQTTP